MSSKGLNNYTVSGNLAADIEVKDVTTRSGEPTQVASGTIYVQDPLNRDESFTVGINIWRGSSGWRALKYLKKGALIIVIGSLAPSPYNANDGTARAGLRMTVDSIVLDIIPHNEDEEQEPVAKPQHSSNGKAPEYETVRF